MYIMHVLTTESGVLQKVILFAVSELYVADDVRL